MNEHQKAQVIILTTFLILFGGLYGLQYLEKQKELRAWAFYGSIKYLSVEPNFDTSNYFVYSNIPPDFVPQVKTYPQILSEHITFSMDYKGITFLMPNGTNETLWVKIKLSIN